MQSLPVDLLMKIVSDGVWSHAELRAVRGTCKVLQQAVAALQGNPPSYGKAVYRWDAAMEQHALPHQKQWSFGNVHAFHFRVREFARDNSENLYKRAADFADVPVLAVDHHAFARDYAALHVRNLGQFLVRSVPASLAVFTGVRSLCIMSIRVAFTLEALVDSVPACDSFWFQGTRFLDSPRLSATFKGRKGLHAFATVAFEGDQQWFPFAADQEDVALQGWQFVPCVLQDALLDLFPRVQTLRLTHCDIVLLQGVRFGVAALHLQHTAVPSAALFPALRQLTVAQDSVDVFRSPIPRFPLLQSVTLRSKFLHRTTPVYEPTLETLPVALFCRITDLLAYRDLVRLKGTSCTLRDGVCELPLDAARLRAPRTLHSCNVKFLDRKPEMLRLHYGSAYAFRVQTDAKTTRTAFDRCIRHQAAFADLYIGPKTTDARFRMCTYHAARCVFADIHKVDAFSVLQFVRTAEVVYDNVNYPEHDIPDALHAGATTVTLRNCKALHRPPVAFFRLSKTGAETHYELRGSGAAFLDVIRGLAAQAPGPVALTLTDVGRIEAEQLPARLRRLQVCDGVLLVASPMAALEELTLVNAQCQPATAGLFPRLQRVTVRDVLAPAAPIWPSLFGAGVAFSVVQDQRLPVLLVDGTTTHVWPVAAAKRRRV